MRLHLSVWIIAIIASAVDAQMSGLGGVVSDYKGKPVSGAIITLQSRQIRDTTGIDGIFRIACDSGQGTVKPFSRRSAGEKITFANQCMLISLANPCPVQIEFFSVKGQLLDKVDQPLVPAGDYRFDLAAHPFAAAVMIIRVSTGLRTATVRHIPVVNGRRTTASTFAAPSSRSGLSGTPSAVDSLEVSAQGFIKKMVPVFSCRDAVNITILQQVFGTVMVRVIPENTQNDESGRTMVAWMLFNDPEPAPKDYEEVMVEGCCRLFKRINPLCAPGCGTGMVCVESDRCMHMPVAVSGGTATVSGFRKNGVATPVTLQETNGSYRLSGVASDFPPFNEGDTLTVTFAGGASVPPFFLKARAIAPLKFLTRTVTLGDGRPVTLTWEPPSVPGASRITVRINLTEESIGTKGEIRCDCEDNGELTVSAAMIDKLKSYGIGGFPVADVVRRSIGSDATGDKNLILGSPVTMYLTYPGITSCTPGEECPGGEECPNDWLCR